MRICLSLQAGQQDAYYLHQHRRLQRRHTSASRGTSACIPCVDSYVARLEVFDNLIQLRRSGRVRSGGRLIREGRQGCRVLGAALPFIAIVVGVRHLLLVRHLSSLCAQRHWRRAAEAGNPGQRPRSCAVTDVRRARSAAKLAVSACCQHSRHKGPFSALMTMRKALPKVMTVSTLLSTLGRRSRR